MRDRVLFGISSFTTAILFQLVLEYSDSFNRYIDNVMLSSTVLPLSPRKPHPPAVRRVQDNSSARHHRRRSKLLETNDMIDKTNTHADNLSLKPQRQPAGWSGQGRSQSKQIEAQPRVKILKPNPGAQISCTRNRVSLLVDQFESQSKQLIPYFTLIINHATV